jgi:hypothetical protein
MDQSKPKEVVDLRARYQWKQVWFMFRPGGRS